MAERNDSDISIERIDNLSIVSLKVSRKSLDVAQDKLRLASLLRVAGDDPRSLWLGPDRWLLISNTTTPDSIVKNCQETLVGILHNAVDYSDALAVLRISGSGAGQVLASGSGIDFRSDKFTVGACCRTQLAHIAAVIVAETAGQFDVYVDRSYGTYLNDWLADASKISAYAAAV